MLTTLRIKNLALVTDLTLELQPGCNVITGETGAGKSIIIGALNLVLGERADRTLIRSGEESCSVEAVFDVGVQASACSGALKRELQHFLEENGLEPCEDNQLVLKRTFTAAGANRQFINGSPTTLATLADHRRMAGGHARPARSSVAAASRRNNWPFWTPSADWKRSAKPSANSSAAAPRWKPKNPRSSWMKKPTRSNWICSAFKSRKFPPRGCNPDEDEAGRGRNSTAPATRPSCCN